MEIQIRLCTAIIFTGLILNEQYNLSLFFKAVIAKSYLLVACSAVMKAFYRRCRIEECCIV